MTNRVSTDHTHPSSLVMQLVTVAAFIGSDGSRRVKEVKAVKTTTSVRAVTRSGAYKAGQSP